MPKKKTKSKKVAEVQEEAEAEEEVQVEEEPKKRRKVSSTATTSSRKTATTPKRKPKSVSKRSGTGKGRKRTQDYADDVDDEEEEAAIAALLGTSAGQEEEGYETMDADMNDATEALESISSGNPFDALLRDDFEQEMQNMEASYSAYIPEDEQQLDDEEEEDDELVLSDDDEEDPSLLTQVGKENATNPKEDVFGADMDEILGIGGRKRKKRKKSKKSKLSPELSSMMGEANMLYASQQFPEAVALLLEVVRQAPNVVDPYHTLGLIYEEMGDLQKSLEFFMIAAHLTPKDGSLWKRLGLMSRDFGKPRQATYCFTKAIRCNPDDLDAIWDRSIIYAEIKQYKKAIEGFESLRNRVDEVDISKEIARCYHEMGQTEKAIETLEQCVALYKANVDYHLVNILMELYMGVGEFERAISLINKISAQRADALPVDIIVGLGICEIYTGDLDSAEIHLSRIFEESVNIYGDLYYNLGATYMAVAEYEKAIGVFESLISNPDYDKPTIWLKQANCHRAIKNISEAIQCYQKDACLSLASLYKETDNFQKALGVVNNHLAVVGTDYRSGRADLRVLVQKCFLHYALNQYDEFIEQALVIVQDPFLRGQPHTGRKRKRATKKENVSQDEGEGTNLLRFSRPTRKKDKNDAPADAEEIYAQVSVVKIIGVDDYITIVMQCCKVLSFLERYEEAGKIIQSVIPYLSTVLPPAEKEKLNQLRFLGVGIAFNNSDFTTAYESVRYVCSQRPYSVPMWNLFNKIITKTGNFTSHAKFITRLLIKYPESVPLLMLLGHHSAMSGSFRLALREYLKAYQLMPDEPLINLCIGLAFLNQVMNRRLADRHSAVLQAFTFLFKYHKLSNNDQESNYNLARAFHQLGINHLALPYYEKVLKDTKADNQVNLKREAAYNLSLIYKASGSPHLAAKILQEYCAI